MLSFVFRHVSQDILFVTTFRTLKMGNLFQERSGETEWRAGVGRIGSGGRLWIQAGPSGRTYHIQSGKVGTCPRQRE